MDIQTTPFTPDWEIEYMADLIEDDTDISQEEVKSRLQLCRLGEKQNASNLSATAGAEHVEWLEDLGYSWSKLSRLAREKRFEAKEEWHS